VNKRKKNPQKMFPGHFWALTIIFERSWRAGEVSEDRRKPMSLQSSKRA